MIISYLRSSSLANFSYCEIQYFITYVLGWRQDSGHKANKGTIVHKSLECLAKCKLALQNGKTEIDDDVLGKFSFDEKDMFRRSTLDSSSVETINKGRINKSIYKMPCQISYGHTRMGSDIAEHISDVVYEYYKDNNEHNDWKPADKRDCNNWMWMALDYKDGMYDPRKRNIFSIEQRFDFEINKDWAKYDFFDKNGQRVIGNLAVKGTIDLILLDELGFLEALDWKTGQRLNWATMAPKTYSDLQKDPQLLLYFYALTNTFPDVDGIVSTIFFVRDGGPFSMIFEEEEITKTEDMLRKKFEEISKCQTPRPLDVKQKDFRCTRLCDYYKKSANDLLGNGAKCNMCTFIKQELNDKGMKKVVELYSNPDHHINQYHAPGEISDSAS